VLDRSGSPDSFAFAWMCSTDGGSTYSAVSGCRWNNTTSRIHQLTGKIPAEWDNLAGFDTDMRVGRITAEGYVTRFGDLHLACEAPGPDCHPLKLVAAFAGRYASGFDLSPETASFHPINLPERDLYFCSGVQCAEDDPGAMPSGWVGPSN
jgi:hypothetical protein